MAQRVVVQLVDDLTGEDIKDGSGETVTFALDGQQYSIDLTTKNADKFRGLFQDYIGVASKVGRKASGRGARSAQGGPAASEVREWARSNGHTVPDRGRIPASVREAYDAAH